MKTTRTYIYKVMAGIAGACLLAACTDDRLDPAQEEGERYDGPLRITARIDGQVWTRSTYPEGPVTDGSTWYLFYPLKSNQDNPIPSFLKATFGSSGYADLKDTTGAPVELTWGDLGPVLNYLFVMDNVRREVFSDNHFYSEYNDDEEGDNVYIGRGVKFTAEEIESYRAALETEDGKNNSNDVIQGYTSFTSADVGKKSYIEIPLVHLMARLSVEVTSSVIDLAGKPVKVRIDHLASESYALNRLRSGDYEQNTLVIHPLRDDKTVIYHPDSTDADFYNHTFYLNGSSSEGENLILVEGKENTYRTRRLILPPQSTHLNGELQPRVYIEVDGKRYSSLIPGSITVEGSPVTFGEFKSNQDIVLSADISGRPPHISLSARVQKWTDKGSWVLETKEGGIYSEDDFKEAVQKFNEYVKKLKGESESKDEKELDKLKHGLEHYGHWTDSVFTFEFFMPLGGGSGSEEAYPGSCLVDTLGENLFNTDLKHHSVYGCDGNSTYGKENLKARMLGRYVADGDTLESALEAYDDYVQYVVTNNGKSDAEVEAEKAKRRKELEKYGWWKMPDGGTFLHLHINIVSDISGTHSQMTLDANDSPAKQFLDLELNGHTVWGKSNAEELEKELYPN